MRPGHLLAVAFALLCGSAAPAAAQSAAAPPAATTAPPPVRAYAQLPFLSAAQLSPDGRRVAVRIIGDQDRIRIYDHASQDRRAITIPVAGADSFQWAGDDRLLISVLRFAILSNGNVGYLGPVRRIISHDLRTAKSEILGNGEGVVDNVIFIDPHGRYLLLTSQASIEATPGVYQVDLSTNQTSLIERPRPGVWSWHADANGVVRVGVDYGERRTRIFYRAQRGAPLQRVEARRNLADDNVIDDVRFISDSGRGIIVTNAQTGRFGVYEYDFASDAVGATLFDHPEVDVDSAIFSQSGALEGVQYDDGRPRYRWFTPDLIEMQANLDRTFPGKTNVIINRSLDGNRALIWSAAANDPGTYYVYDRAARRMEIFASPYDTLQDLPHAEVRPIRFQSPDGLTLHGYLTLPRGRPERGLPLVVVAHGGPFARDSWLFDPEVQFLASRGYAVLQVNFRGSTGYGREFVSRGYGQLGSGMINDLEAGIDWLAAQGTIDPARVCIMGSSYGGYAAVWAATRNPSRYRCAISFAGPSDLRSMLRHTTRGFAAPRYSRAYRRQIQGDPPVNLEAISPLRHVERLRAPVLIAHGRNDIIVPVEQSEQLIRALTRVRAPVESVIYPKAGHDFTDAAEHEDFLTRVEAFLARHNPVAQPAPAP